MTQHSHTTLSDIRTAFLTYFQRHDHEVCSSGSLVPHNDPTLMFANAGMNQFKDVFTGVETRPYVRATSAQKCVRAGGKHNDLDNVGYTARHHTFFEMMGNFSFGDYFKEEAIVHGWNFLTKELGLPAEKLLVTVYHDDDVAWNLWKKIAGLPDEKIIRIATSDNFWSMGDTGPCGPCSEIFYDHGEHIPGGPPGSADEDGDRFIEVWNLVFMQYEQLADGSRINLPKPSIDTGMGLERMVAIVQGVHNNYEIDLFQNMIECSEREAQRLIPKDHSPKPNALTSHRVIADHMRSSCFLMADGVLPSNEGRGYVLRRIMRRAMRHAHMLGCAEPLMHKLVPNLVELMGMQYPELGRAQAAITENLRSEEERFKQTLERGLKLLDEETTSIKAGGSLTGSVAFKLYDTYGFPLDLTQDILRGQGMTVDTDGFDACMSDQKTRARQAWKGSGEAAVGNMWFELKEKHGETTFTGYDEDASDATILAIVSDGEVVQSAEAGSDVSIILDRTPCYGESGGQAGDAGILTRPACGGGGARSAEGGALATITDTQKPLDGFHVHHATLSAPIHVGDAVTARIDVASRTTIRANHSATHLVHKALRDTLGEHVTQKGSLVDPEKLRFDFSHGKAVSAEEIAAIETQVNQAIARATDVRCQVMSPDDAMAAGAMALFGEKYGDEVRVLTIGATESGEAYSVELCGGTHVRNTGDIQTFKIISEGSVAAGIRRIEALTGEAVRDYMVHNLAKQAEQLAQMVEHYKQLAPEAAPAQPSFSAEQLKSIPLAELNTHYADLSQQFQTAAAAIQDASKALQKKQAAEKAKQALSAVDDLAIETIGGLNFAATHVPGASPKDLRPLAEAMLKQAEPGVVLATSENDGKVGVIVAVSKSLTEAHNAVSYLKLVVGELGGQGGGGRPDFAQGGAADASNIEAATDALRKALAAS